MIEGQLVWLKANVEEGWPAQRAMVEDIGKVILVRITDPDPTDDGLREITEDQIDVEVCGECGHAWSDREDDGLCHHEYDDIKDGSDGWPMAHICWCDNIPDADA